MIAGVGMAVVASGGDLSAGVVGSLAGLLALAAPLSIARIALGRSPIPDDHPVLADLPVKDS